jgi:hypothetical protein
VRRRRFCWIFTLFGSRWKVAFPAIPAIRLVRFHV